VAPGPAYTAPGALFDQKECLTMLLKTERTIASWVLSAPLLLLLASLLIWPLVLGVQTAFSRDRLSEFEVTAAGLDNFITLLNAPNFWSSLGFTLSYAVIVTSLEIVLGFTLALLFDRAFPAKKLLFSLMLVPIMVAPALLAVMFRLILNENIGLVPGLLRLMGLEVSIFAQKSIFTTLVSLDMLEYTAFTFLLSYSSLQSMPKELFESAAIDGASARQTLFRVTLPILQPSLFIIFLLRFLDSLRTFDLIYIMTGGGPGTTTQTVGIYIFKAAFAYGDFGLASAAAILIVLFLVPFMPGILRQFNLAGERK
jgi:multiple sugar transport system permease protein